MSSKMHVIQPDGSVSTTEITALPGRKELQAIVGGFHEPVRVLGANGAEAVLVVNETGAINPAAAFGEGHENRPPLQPNARATAIYWTATILGRTGVRFDPFSAPMIHGPAVLFDGYTKDEL